MSDLIIWCRSDWRPGPRVQCPGEGSCLSGGALGAPHLATLGSGTWGTGTTVTQPSAAAWDTSSHPPWRGPRPSLAALTESGQMETTLASPWTSSGNARRPISFVHHWYKCTFWERIRWVLKKSFWPHQWHNFMKLLSKERHEYYYLFRDTSRVCSLVWSTVVAWKVGHFSE